MANIFNPDIQISMIDADVALLHDQIRKLHTQRNSFTRTCSIPQEVLAEIFSHCRCNVIMHVCKHWREVALSAPCLWSTVVFHHGPSPLSPWTDLKLERSKHSPLDLEVHVEEALDKVVRRESVQVSVEETLVKALRQLPHIRNLRITCLHSVMPFLLQHLTGPAPKLEALHVCRKGREQSGGNEDFISDAFLAETTPLLRALSLEHCMIHLNSPIWSNVETLNLAYVPEGLMNTTQELLSLLRNMPALHILKLVEALPRVTSASSWFTKRGQDVVSLPRLKKLVITDILTAYGHFMPYLDIPPTARVKLHMEDASDETFEYPRKAALLPESILAASPQVGSISPSHTLKIEGEYWGASRWCIQLCCEHADCQAACFKSSSRYSTYAHPDHEGLRTEAHFNLNLAGFSLLANTFRMISLRDVHTLKLWIPKTIDGPSPWRDIFKSTSRVRRLILSAIGVMSVYDVIRDLDPEGPDLPDDCPLPDLSELHLELHVRHYNSRNLPSGTKVISLLQRALTARADLGVVLPKLVLDGDATVMFKEQQETLSGLVQEVVWRGK